MADRGSSGRKSARKSIGLGFVPDELQHGFILHLPASKAATAQVIISEHREFVLEDGEVCAPPIMNTEPSARVFMDRSRWEQIAVPFWEEASRRVRHAGLSAPRLRKRGAIPLHPSLGKELCILCWAIESADPALIPEAIRNWEGLAPEERWWLYTMTAGATGQADQRNIGWRKALRFALTENPIIKGQGLAPRSRKQLLGGYQLSLL